VFFRIILSIEDAGKIQEREGRIMPKIHKQIDIKAPAKKVFAYIEDPENDPEWMASMMEVKDVTGSGVGKRFNWTYKMAGVRLHGETKFTEEIPDKRLVVETKGGVESTWTFSLEPREDVTILDLDIDYTIPVPVLGKLAEKVLTKRNEREADMNLTNLKERLEK
jgi:uncharacterized membrane protein